MKQKVFAVLCGFGAAIITYIAVFAFLFYVVYGGVMMINQNVTLLENLLLTILCTLSAYWSARLIIGLNTETSIPFYVSGIIWLIFGFFWPWGLHLQKVEGYEGPYIYLYILVSAIICEGLICAMLYLAKREGKGIETKS